MVFEKLNIRGLVVVTPKRISDDRGFFMETFVARRFNEAAGKDVSFVQDNHSLTRELGTIRGLHYQSPPHAQGKLVRCTRGRIMDVAVDVRSGSSTYGKHVRVELSVENHRQLWVPSGFLHGFCTLEPDTEVVYKVTDYYSPECDGNVQWNDPDLAIDWGIKSEGAVLSGRDMVAPAFSSFKSPF